MPRDNWRPARFIGRASAVFLAGLGLLTIAQPAPVLAQQGVTRSQAEAVGSATENQLRQAARRGAAPPYLGWSGTYQSSWVGYPPPLPTYPPPQTYRSYAPYP